jgi:hypothetical protein
MPTGGASGLWWVAVLLSAASAVAGVGVPVLRFYEPPPAVATDDAKTAKPAAPPPSAQPSQQWIAIQTAFQAARPQLTLPATLGLVTFVLIVLNRPLSSVMANLLPGSMGKRAAGQIPLIAMVAVSLVALGIGLTRPGRDAAETNAQNPISATAAEGESQK